MKKTSLPVILGISHGISDCSAGLLLGSLSRDTSIFSIGALVLLYNILAFGAQPLAGLLIDKLKSPKIATVFGMALMIAAIVLFYVNPIFSVILAGLASAVFHTGGGALALCISPGNASNAGIFAAPGVAGLAIGGYLAVNGIFPSIIIILALVILSLFIIAFKQPVLPYNFKADDTEFEKHDFVMLILLLAIALRSAVWNIFQYINQGEITTLILISLAAASGKIIGGFAGDYFGWKRYSYTVLLAAIPLLIFGEYSIYFLLPGIALLQSVTPIMVSAVYKNIKKLPATAAGLSFGFAIAAGGLPFIQQSGINDNVIRSPLVLAGIILLTVILVIYGIKRKRESFAS
ncbi:MAG: MFS transporter [Ignavibacteria bacterium]|nr:MFS transporter [Ignavibacteria bacterium]